MDQKTTEVYLRTVIEFADENGYRIIGGCLQCDKNCNFDRDEIEEWLHAPDLRVRCKLVGCGIDFRRSVTLNGNYEFLLVS